MDSEPLFQAAAYYTSFIKQKLLKDLEIHSPFPCFVLCLIGEGCSNPSPAGATLGFVGLVFTDRTNIQVLERPIRLDYHHTDHKLRTMAARYFGELRKAWDKLKIYYAYDLEPQFYHWLKPQTTLYTLYHDIADSVQCSVTYFSQPVLGTLISFGESNRRKVCVNSSPDIQRKHTRSVLPWESTNIERIRDSTWGMVHGSFGSDRWCVHAVGHRDSRTHRRSLCFIMLDMCTAIYATLIWWSGKMVNIHGDLAGAIRKVRYPMNVNTDEALGRPPDVYDGEIIRPWYGDTLERLWLRVECSSTFLVIIQTPAYVHPSPN